MDQTNSITTLQWTDIKTCGEYQYLVLSLIILLIIYQLIQFIQLSTHKTMLTLFILILRPQKFL
jgi:hypothetical protein